MTATGLEASRAGHTMLKRLLQPAASSDSPAVLRKIIRCDECASEQPAVSFVKLRFLCADHFAAYCYERLDEAERTISAQNPHALRSCLRECATEAAKVLLMARGLQNIDRARLFDIILWSNELFYRLATPNRCPAPPKIQRSISSASALMIMGHSAGS